jgi:hypothetical protein
LVNSANYLKAAFNVISMNMIVKFCFYLILCTYFTFVSGFQT